MAEGYVGGLAILIGGCLLIASGVLMPRSAWYAHRHDSLALGHLKNSATLYFGPFGRRHRARLLRETFPVLFDRGPRWITLVLGLAVMRYCPQTASTVSGIPLRVGTNEGTMAGRPTESKVI